MMNSNQIIDTSKAYLDGMLLAAYGVRIFDENVTEWQLDQVKECAKQLKEAEIDHSVLTLKEKENQKRLWKQWLDATTHGLKDMLKAEGRLI